MKMKKSSCRINHQNDRIVPLGLILLLIIASCLTVVTNTTSAATYYLDAVNGNDNNPGTSEQPWKTLARAYNSNTLTPNIEPGDTVYLRNGNYGAYSERLTASRSNWITYKADTGHTPVFTKIEIASSTARDAYLKFDGIDIQHPAYNPVDDGYWHIKSHDPNGIGKLIETSKVNYLQFLNGHYRGYHKYLSEGCYFTHSNYVTIQRCEITKVAGSFIDFSSCDNIIVNNCYVHDSILGSGIRVEGTVTSALFENNHLWCSKTDVTDEYFPHIDASCDISYTTIDGGVFEVNETVIQESSLATGWVTKIATGKIWVERGATKFDKVNKITGQTSRAYITPTDVQETTEWHPGSGFSIRSSNITARKNIVHGPFSQGYMNYNTTGNVNFTIENNLFYDTGTVAFEHLNGSGVIRNNTCIGYVADNRLGKYNIVSRYSGGMLNIGFQSPFNGAGVKIYNNICVAKWALPKSTDANFVYEEDYNIFWNKTDGLPPKGIHSVLRVWNDSDSPFAAEGYPNYFEDTGYRNSTPEWVYVRDGITPFFVDPNFYTSNSPNVNSPDTGKYQIWDYHLAPGSPGINFGDPNNQPSDSLGSLEPNGFINDNGPTRNASHHSAGCYEYPYTSTDLLFAPIGNKEVNEGSTLTFIVDVNDPNVEPFIKDHDLPSEPSVTNHIFSWTPTYNDAGSYEATFAAQNDLFEDSETISILVNNVNRPPVLAVISDKSVNEGSSLSFSVSATDPDGDAITYSAEGLPSGATFANQTFNWTPNYSQAGTYQVTLAATDGQAQDSETVSLTVNNVNRPPVLAAISDKSVNEGSSLSFQASATDPDGDAIIYSAEGLPSGATFANQTFNWTPGYDQAGTCQVTFTATDGQAQNSQTVNITVNVNRAPVLTAISDKSVNEGSLLSFQISATDPDGDAITYSAEGLPNGATFAGQTFNWTPGYDQAGTYQIIFTATDGQAQDSQTVNLTVNNVGGVVTDATTILLDENFDNDTLADWSIIDEGTTDSPSSWSAASGTMVQKSNIYTLSSPGRPGTYALYKAGTSWTDYRVSLTMKSDARDFLGIMFRYKDEDNYYRFSWSNNYKLCYLVKKCNGQYTMLSRSIRPYIVGRIYQIDIVANGTRLQVFIDNKLLLQAKDSSLSSGSIALYSWANAGSYFDNIVVQKL
jgi:hypothetical protein